MQQARLPRRRGVAAAVAAAFTLAPWAPALADGDPVAEAYQGPVTQAKLDAALAGLNGLLIAIGNQFGTSAGSSNDFAGGGNLDVLYLVPDTTGFPMISAASDADLGAPGQAVVLDGTGLRVLGSFSTGRDFTIGGSDFDGAILAGGGGAGSIFGGGFFLGGGGLIGLDNINGGLIDTNGFDLTISGQVTALGFLFKAGAGTLELSGANTWNGKTIYVENGTLRGGTASLQAPVHSIATVEFRQDQDGSYGANLTGGGVLVKSGSGSVTLTSGNNEVSEAVVQSGALKLAGAGTLGGARLNIASGAVLDLSTAIGERVTSGMSGAGGIVLGADGLRLASNANWTFDGVISGVGGLRKAGAGTLTLTGQDTYSGTTVLSEGGLALAGTGGLSATGEVSMASGTSFSIAAADGDREIGILSGGGTLDLGANTLTVGGNNQSRSFGGSITGSGGLTKTGTGTLELTGSNSYTGTTTIAQGTIDAEAGSLGPVVVNNGTLELHRSIFPSSIIAAYSGDISGTGVLVKTGGGAIWLRGHNSYTGGTTVSDGALIGNTDSLTGDIANNALLAFYQVEDGTYSGDVSGTGTLLQYGPGVLTLTGNNSHTGGTAFSGTVRVASDASLGDAAGQVLLVGGRLQAAADLTLGRPLNLAAQGGILDTDGHSITHTGTLGGSGALVKAGAGTLTLAGNASPGGGTTVAAGRLAVTGNLAGNIAVLAGAELGGTGTLGGHLLNAGRIARGAGIGDVQVGGNLTFLPGSTLTVKTDAAGNADRLVAGGGASLQGGTVEVLAGAGNYADRTRYTILDATGGVTGQFAGVNTNLVFLTPSLEYDPDAVHLNLTRNAVAYQAVAATPRQAAVARALSGFGISGDAATVLGAINALTADQARAAFESIAAPSRAGLTQVSGANQRALVQTALGRLGLADAGGSTPGGGLATLNVHLAFADETRSDAPPVYAAASGISSDVDGGYDPAVLNGMWLRGYGGSGQVDGNDTAAGYSYRLNGVAAGYDRQLGEGLTVGVLAAYARPRFEQGADTTRMRSRQLGAYGRFRSGPVHADAVLSVGNNRFETARQVVVGTLAREATAGFDGDSRGLHLETGYTFGGTTRLQPVVSLDWSRQKQDGYTESGAGALNLVVPDRTVDSLRGGLGLRAIRAFDTAGGTRMNVEGRIAWSHEFEESAAVTARLAGDTSGASFSASGVDIPPNSIQLGLGLSGQAGRNLRFHADLDGEFNHAQQTVTLALGLRYRW